MFSAHDLRKVVLGVGSLGLASIVSSSGWASGEPPCGSTAESRVRPGISFARYQTFAIKNPDASKFEGGEESDLPETAEVHLKKANIEAASALEAGGLEEVDPGKESPDLWIASAASTKVEEGVAWDCVAGWEWWGWYPEFDACPWVEPIPVKYTAGTLVVSLVDAETNEVVFGGLVPGMLACSGDVNGSIAADVEQIFADYPFKE